MAPKSYGIAAVRRRLTTLGARPAGRWEASDELQRDQLAAAAVLIALCEHDDELYIWLTRRSRQLRKHSGEVSFPGGGREAQDASLEQTALREAHEEIGLRPADVEVFGPLTSLATITGFDVTAYVGEFGWPYRLEKNPDEIEVLFEVPLSVLSDPQHHRLEQRQYDGRRYPVHFFDTNGEVIWGATGFLVYSLLEYLELAP